MSDDLPEYVRRNREVWDVWAADYVADAERSWRENRPSWGIWGVPEAELRLLDDVDGHDAIELGCGTAYVSSWLARRGARPVGIDNSAAQLATARRLQQEHGLEFLLLHGNAEAVPLPDASFDLAISEYGACLWADPYTWVPEAARLLRPGGRLVFLTSGWLSALCMPDEEGSVAGDRLVRPAFGLHRIDWSDDHSSAFYVSHAEWIRVLRESGFAIEALLDVRPPAEATTRFQFMPLAWARQWPCEEVWKARKG